MEASKTNSFSNKRDGKREKALFLYTITVSFSCSGGRRSVLKVIRRVAEHESSTETQGTEEKKRRRKSCWEPQWLEASPLKEEREIRS
ncbi:hypothetical protein SLE2022_320530 [Rubroshorea leprosula]